MQVAPTSHAPRLRHPCERLPPPLAGQGAVSGQASCEQLSVEGARHWGGAASGVLCAPRGDSAQTSERARPLPWRPPPVGSLGRITARSNSGGKTVNARRVVSLETKEHGTAPASESSETSEPALCTLPAHSDLAQIARSTWDRRLSAARARAPRARWASTPARAAAPPPALPRHPPPARSLRRRPLYPASLGTPP